MITYLVKIKWLLETQFLRFRGMRIGKYSYVANTLFIHGVNRVLIADKVRIFPGVRMETHQDGYIDIHEDVSIGQNFHITSAGDRLKIGAHTTISGNVGRHILKQPLLVRHTEIGENCFIGYGAAIQAGTVLGRQCIVGANSVVRGEFPDYCVIVGAPARIVKRYNPVSGEWEKNK